MDPTDVCPNCGISILHSEDHRCPLNKDVCKRCDDNNACTSILDNTVEERMPYEELLSELEKRGNFSSSDNEEFQENTFKKTEDKPELKNLNLLKKNPLISEGNPISPINEEGFIEINPEEAFEENRISAENLENVGGFVSIDTFLFLDEPISIVSQYGNPLDGLPFENLVIEESSDWNRNKHKHGVARRQSIRHDATMAKNRQKSSVAGSKRDCSGLFPPSLQNISEGAPAVDLARDIESSPAKINRTSHSRSKSKKSPLKHSSPKSHRYGVSTITCSAQRSDEALVVLHDHQYECEETSSILPSDRQTYKSKPDQISRHPKSKSKKSPFKSSPRKSHHDGESTITSSTQKSDEALKVLHDHQYESEETSSTLPSGRQTYKSKPDQIERSRHPKSKSKKSPFKPSPRKSHCYDKSTITCSTQRSDEALKVWHDHQYESEDVSSISPSGRKACQSRSDHIERSRHPKSKSKKSPLKPSSPKSHRYGESTIARSAQMSDEALVLLQDHQNESTITCSAQMSDEALIVLHDHQYESEEPSSILPSGRQAGQSESYHIKPSTSESQTTNAKHSPKKLFSCDQCGRIYLDLEKLENHMIFCNTQYGYIGTKPEGNQACISNPALSSEPEVSTSSSNQSPLKLSFRCDTCGTVFRKKRSYETHLFLNSKVKPHICKDCGKFFASKCFLKNHSRRHTGERRYICSECGHGFFQKGNLNAHFRLHTGQLDFSCEHCGKKFAFKSLLCKHQRRHTK